MTQGSGSVDWNSIDNRGIWLEQLCDNQMDAGTVSWEERLNRIFKRVTGGMTAALLALAAGCAVGPGTPLVDALKTEPGAHSANVPPPKGYGPPIGTGVSAGLINPQKRAATEAYLESLANR